MAVQHRVNKLFRTKPELSPTPRRIYEVSGVVHGLGLANADQQQIQRLVNDIPASWEPRMQTQRSFLAKGRLIETLRSMKWIPSETRQEIVKRATAYWKATMQTEYDRKPTVRYTARKSLAAIAHTIPLSALSKAGPYIGPKGGLWADAKHTKPYKAPKGGTLVNVPGQPGVLKRDPAVVWQEHKPLVSIEGKLAKQVNRALDYGSRYDEISRHFKLPLQMVRNYALKRARAEKAKKSEVVPGRDIPATGRMSQAAKLHAYYMAKAAKGEAAGQHKYEERKPDGHGGWLYKYPGEGGFQAGKGAHAETTQSMPGEHLDPHHKGYKPTVEPREGGGFTLHAGEGVSSEFKPGMSLRDHVAQWDHHKGAHDKATEAGNHAAAAAHKHALKAHSQAHNMKQDKMRELQGKPPAEQPQKPRPTKAEAEHAARDGVEAGAPPDKTAAPPPGAPGAQQGPPQQAGAAPAQGAPAAPGAAPGAAPANGSMSPDGAQPSPAAGDGSQGEAVGPDGQPMGAAQPTGESDALIGGRTRHTEVHPDVQAVQQALSGATKVMSDMVANTMHMGELKDRIKAVKADKSLPRSMRKRMITQHEAEIAAAKADVAKLTEHHDTVMAEVKRAQAALQKPHPILAALLKLFERMRPEKADAETKAQTDKGVDPHEAHRGKRTHEDAAAEHEETQALEAENEQAAADNAAQPANNKPKPSTGAPGAKPKAPTAKAPTTTPQQRGQSAQRLAASFAVAAALAVNELRKAYAEEHKPSYPNGPSRLAGFIDLSKAQQAEVLAWFNRHMNARADSPSNAVPSAPLSELSGAADAPSAHAVSPSSSPAPLSRLDRAPLRASTSTPFRTDKHATARYRTDKIRGDLSDHVAADVAFIVPAKGAA